MPHRLARRPLIPIVLGLTDLALAGVLVAEPDNRVSSPSFAPARQVMPMQVWGLILLLLATAIVIRYTLNRHAGYALSLAGGWYAFFVVSLIAAAWQNTTAGLTGIVIYTGLAVTIHLLAAWRKVR